VLGGGGAPHATVSTLNPFLYISTVVNNSEYELILSVITRINWGLG